MCDVLGERSRLSLSYPYIPRSVEGALHGDLLVGANSCSILSWLMAHDVCCLNYSYRNRSLLLLLLLLLLLFRLLRLLLQADVLNKNSTGSHSLLCSFDSSDLYVYIYKC